jgi:drug/metabolite transporter (DMT)-like permease
MVSSKTKAIILLILITMIWGGTFSLIKVVLNHTTPMFLIFYRFFFAAIASIPFIIPGIKKLKLKSILKLLLLGFFLWIAYIAQTVGLKYTTPSNSAFITGLYVVFTPIFALFLTKEKMTKTMFIAVIFAVMGIFLLAGLSLKEFSFNIGDLITVISAIAFALQIVLTSMFVKKEDIKLIASIQIYTVLLLSAPFLSSTKQFNLPVWITLSIVFLGTVASFLAILAQTYSLKFIDPDRASILFTLEPIFAALFSLLFLGELLSLQEILGSMFVLLAMFIVVRNNKKAQQNT